MPLQLPDRKPHATPQFNANPKMAKKTRVADTVAGAIGAMVDAAKPPPDVPKHVTLRACDVPFWSGIVRARARDEWTDADLVLAAQLARCQSDIETEQQLIYLEGTVIPNDRGTMVTNPRFRAVNELKQSQLATVRALAMNATAKADSRDIAKRRAVFHGAQVARESLSEDDLIPH